MQWVAVKMLTGDTVKYVGMVFGVAFSTLLISQQGSIFLGLVRRSSTAVMDVRDANIWVMDPRVTNIDGSAPLPDTDLFRIRGVQGVQWAAPFLKQTTTIKTSDGRLESASLFGVDDSSLAGLPPEVVVGDAQALKAPGAVMFDKAGFKFVFKDVPFTPGMSIELNDSRAVIVGLVNSGALFSSQVSIFTRYSAAKNFAAGGRNRMSFVIAKSNATSAPEEVSKSITEATGLKALTREGFAKANSDYIIGNTGIPISFGTVVALGIIVGIVVVALTFTLFIRDNIKQFGALKAIGVSNGKLVKMVLLQGFLVGTLGYFIGLGLAAFLVKGGADNAPALRGFYIPWQVAVFALGVVSVIIITSGMLALRKVLTTDPASVFRG
jgi:putative ABC transport system permease protein